MINAYKSNKDLYSMMASKVYHNNYEDNLEHNPDGSIYEEGKKRRTSVKSLLLGIMYRMGVASIAKTIKGTPEEAKEILEGFYEAFPAVKKWIDETEENAKKVGYVEDWYGRKRRLPDIMLPPYEVSYIDESKSPYGNFNPFLHCKDRVQVDTKISGYLKKCDAIKSYKDYEALKEKAKKEGINIRSNTSIIGDATRQCVNARIQGGAATMTKIAMLKLASDERLNELGFQMLFSVHDELIGECPEEYSEEVAERLSYIMSNCIKEDCETPFKCDADITPKWYYSEYCSSLNKEYKGYVKELGKEEAFEKMCNLHIETLREDLQEILHC